MPPVVTILLCSSLPGYGIKQKRYWRALLIPPGESSTIYGFNVKKKKKTTNDNGVPCTQLISPILLRSKTNDEPILRRYHRPQRHRNANHTACDTISSQPIWIRVLTPCSVKFVMQRNGPNARNAQSLPGRPALECLYHPAALLPAHSTGRLAGYNRC